MKSKETLLRRRPPHGASYVAIALLTFCESPEAAGQDFAGSQYLGWGWDVFQRSDSSDALRSRVIKEQSDSPSDRPDVIGKFKSTYARSASSMVRSLTVQTSLSAEFGAFSGSVDSKYQESNSSSSQTNLAFVTRAYSKKVLYYDEESLRKNLKPAFLADLDNPEVSPESVLDKYGTHVISKIKIGGRLNMYFKSETSKSISSSQFSLAVKAAYPGVKGKVNTSLDQQSTEARENLEFTSEVLGGSDQSSVSGDFIPDMRSLSSWERSLDHTPEYIGRPENSLIPIWRFCANPERHAAIKFAYDVREAKHAIENPVQFSTTTDRTSGIITGRLRAGHADNSTGYKILCGGAQVHYEDYGMMLTSSYPQTINEWHASAKDHLVNDYGNLTISAIAIHDPNNHWKVEIVPFTQKPGPANLVAKVAPRPSYLVGGGGKVLYTGEGSVLRGLQPGKDKTFTAWAGALQVTDVATLTVYGIYLSPRSEAARRLTVETRIFNDRGQKQHKPSKQVGVADWTLVGGGAVSPGKTDGQSLTASLPNGTGWYGHSKDHGEPREYPIDVFAIGLRVTVKPGRN